MYSNTHILKKTWANWSQQGKTGIYEVCDQIKCMEEIPGWDNQTTCHQRRAWSGKEVKWGAHSRWGALCTSWASTCIQLPTRALFEIKGGLRDSDTGHHLRHSDLFSTNIKSPKLVSPNLCHQIFKDITGHKVYNRRVYQYVVSSVPKQLSKAAVSILCLNGCKLQ